MLKLIGSHASPFVRRNRIDLFEKDYVFEAIKVFSKEGQERLKSSGQIRRVPILIDGHNEIADSFLIHCYITKKQYDSNYLQDLWKINEANDSAILLFQFKLFKLDIHWENELSNNHLKRIDDVLSYFSIQEDNNKLTQWDVRSQWLYCFLDWLSFREVIPWETDFPSLTLFIKRFQSLKDVKATDPRN